MPAALVPAIIASSAIGAGGSIASSLIGSKASSNAANAQVAAAQRAEGIANGATAKGQELATGAQGDANNVLSDAVQAQLAMYAPYIQAGGNSLASLQQLAGAGGPLDKQFSFKQSDLEDDPGYQFTLQQGQQAIQRAQAAKGNLFSGSTLKSLASYTTGTANQHFNDAFTRAASTFDINRSTALSRIGTLQGLAGLGLNSTGAASNAVGSGASQIGSNIFRTGEFNADLGLQGARIATGLEQSKGNSQAAGDIGRANAYSSGIGGATNAVSNGIGQFLSFRTLQNLANAGNGGVQGVPAGASGGSIAPYIPAPSYAPQTAPPFNYNYGGVPGGGY